VLPVRDGAEFKDDGMIVIERGRRLAEVLRARGGREGEHGDRQKARQR